MMANRIDHYVTIRLMLIQSDYTDESYWMVLMTLVMMSSAIFGSSNAVCASHWFAFDPSCSPIFVNLPMVVVWPHHPLAPCLMVDNRISCAATDHRVPLLAEHVSLQNHRKRRVRWTIHVWSIAFPVAISWYLSEQAGFVMPKVWERTQVLWNIALDRSLLGIHL